MPVKGFADKFLHKLSRIDLKEIETYVTRLVQERDLFAQIVLHMPEGLLLFDDEEGILFANRAIAHLLNLEEVTEESLSHLFYQGQSFLDYLKLFAQTVAEQGETRDIAYGPPLNKMITITVLPVDGHDTKKRGRRLFLMRDHTQNRKRQADVLDREMLGTFVALSAGIAHEIGNPLNALDIHLQLLEWELKKQRRTAGMKKLVEYVTTARGEIGRLDTIVKNFLKAVRPVRPNFIKADMNKVCDDIIRFMTQECKQKGIKIKKQYCKKIPLSFFDDIQIGQALINIIKNAIDAMPRGGELVLTTECDDTSLRIIVKDTGAGIQGIPIARAFEPYFTTKEHGSGLGLVIVKRIIKEHGGEVTLNNCLPHGLEVIMSIPIREQRMNLLTDTRGKP